MPECPLPRAPLDGAHTRAFRNHRTPSQDGTLSGYYLQRGSGTNASKWIVYLDGGGECADETSCKAHLHDALGSSNYFDASKTLPYILSDSAAANPDFSSWSHLFIPYCTQDLWSGTVREPSAATYGLYFAGHLVLSAVLDAAVATAGLGAATDILLFGASAGGIGVWLNVDWVQGRFPAARVSAVTIAGYYFYSDPPYTGPNHTSSVLADFRQAAWPQHVALW